MTIGEYIRYLRTQRFLSLSDLSRKAGVTKSLLSRLENNLQTDITIETARKIAAGLGMSAAALIQVGDVSTLPQIILDAEARVSAAKDGAEYVRALIALHDAVKAAMPGKGDS